MPLTDDLATLQEAIRHRVAGNVDQSALSTAQRREDQNRLLLLNALTRLVQDPTYSGQLDQVASTQVDATRAALDTQATGANGALAGQAAVAGTLGGSRVRAAKGRVVAARNKGVQDAAQAAAEWKTQAGQSRESTIRDYLDNVISPQASEGAAGSLALQGAADATAAERRIGDLNQTLAQNQGQYRALLANTLAGVVNNGVTPAIGAGFQRADRLNANADRANQINYYNTGTYGTNRADRTWSLWGD